MSGFEKPKEEALVSVTAVTILNILRNGKFYV